MTGTSSSNSLAGFRHRAVLVAALVFSAAGAGAASGAESDRRRADRCGYDQVACATAVLAGARQQAGKEEPDRGKDRDRDKDRDRRDGPGRDGDGRRGRSGGGYELGWGYGRGHSDMRAPRPHEWDETQNFMRLYATRRHAAIEQLPDGEAKESMKKYWFARYRGVQSLQKRDPIGHEQRLAQLRIEDQIFGIISDWAGPDKDPDRLQLRDTLRTQVTQLVELDLMERQRKVEALKRELAEQTELLKSDEAQRDALVDKRVSRFADWAARWASRRKQSESEKDKEKQKEQQQSGERQEDPGDPGEKREKRD